MKVQVGTKPTETPWILTTYNRTKADGTHGRKEEEGEDFDGGRDEGEMNER